MDAATSPLTQDRETPPVVLPPEAEQYLTWLVTERGRAPRTIEAYRRDLVGYVGWLADRGETLASANDGLIVAWLRERQDLGRAERSVARELAAVRSLHRFCAAEGLLPTNPTIHVEIPKVPASLPKALSEEQVTSLIDVIDTSTPAGLRDRAMIELLYGAGLRISELIGMSLRDLDLESGMITVFGKGAKERMVPLGRCAYEALIAYLQPTGRGTLEPKRWASRDDSEAIFLNSRGGRLSRQGAWGVVKKYAAAVGLSAKLSPHVLRHSCATHMLDHGADIRVVQELLGHASITTTQIYTKVSQERLFAVHAAAHPRAKRRPVGP